MEQVLKYVGFLLQPAVFLFFQIVILVVCVVIAVEGPAAAILSGFVVVAHPWAAGACVLTPLLSLLINRKPRPSVIAYILAAPVALTVMLSVWQGHIDPILNLARGTLLTYLTSAVPFAAWYYLNTRAQRR
jgi:hypothetical protein